MPSSQSGTGSDEISEPGRLIVSTRARLRSLQVIEGRRFIDCDIDPGRLETTRRRLVVLTCWA
jgi:hypothetical protein